MLLGNKVGSVMCAVFLFLAWTSFTPAATFDLAAVQVHETGAWRPLAAGQAVHTFDQGATPIHWHSFPANVPASSLDFYYIGEDSTKSRVDYGKVDFTIVESGMVWMITSDRFLDSGRTSGNSDGNWKPEATLRAELEADGWALLSADIKSETGRNPFGQNVVNKDNGWLLWQRDSTAGDVFSLRNEKYIPPILLQGTVPEPVSLGLLMIGGLMLRRHRPVALC